MRLMASCPNCHEPFYDNQKGCDGCGWDRYVERALATDRDCSKGVVMIKRVKFEVYWWIWTTWHSDLRRFFDKMSGRTYFSEPRPWWHLCCNGNSGGWRTTFCNYFDDYVHNCQRPWEKN